MYDLLRAYADQHAHAGRSHGNGGKRAPVYAIDEAAAAGAHDRLAMVGAA